MADSTRTLLVIGKKTARITIPADAKVTFGPFSPPSKDGNYRTPEQLKGTLRIYEGGKTKASESVLAVFTEVYSFRDIDSIDYEEQVVIQKGNIVWESDKSGYKVEEAVKNTQKWEANPEMIESGDDDGF